MCKAAVQKSVRNIVNIYSDDIDEYDSGGYIPTKLLHNTNIFWITNCQRWSTTIFFRMSSIEKQIQDSNIEQNIYPFFPYTMIQRDK